MYLSLIPLPSLKIIKEFDIDFVVHGDEPCLVDGEDVSVLLLYPSNCQLTHKHTQFFMVVFCCAGMPMSKKSVCL